LRGKQKKTVVIEGRVITLTNLQKIFWPDRDLTKAHLIKYYLEVAPLLLPHIYNRLLVMKRYPDGIAGEYFYQKECPAYAPEWVETYPVKHTRKVINYIVCNDTATLVWMAHQGCLEVHGWLSTVGNIDNPDLAVFDLDPADGVSFRDVLRVALIVREMLETLGIKGYPKTSGASGVHIFIPLDGGWPFAAVTAVMKFLAEKIAWAHPQIVTLERNKDRRAGKVYLDYLQNGRGKTMAFPYSVRPLPGAPVSAPLTWREVEEMQVEPNHFHLGNIGQRIKEKGDLFAGLLKEKQDLGRVLPKVGRLLPGAEVVAQRIY